MPARHHLKVQIPIPQEVRPANVLATLQTFEPLLSNHYYIAEYQPITGPLSSRHEALIKRDAFFAQESADLRERDRWWACDVWEDVYWVPFLLPYFSRLKRYLAIGCKTASGIRFRQSVAGGVTTRGTFSIVSRRSGRAFAEERESWDGETERGSDAGSGEEGRRSGDDEKSWNGETDIEDGNEGEEEEWDIVCECEIEVPLIISVPQMLMRNAHRRLCEHLCKSVIEASFTKWNEYWFTI
ncbi:hypothetical protein GGS21DRAFT_515752 [Xylaria nigripes]|nr:hypothetical protein GGS21DRAFT_515752 [Xylaria nigripes]